MSKTNVNIDFKEENIKDIEGLQTKKEIVKLNTAKRHAIKINDIQLEKNIYNAESIIKTNNLISNPARSIAIFCNEYVPEHFSAGKWIRYYLTVNGQDFEVVPINSNNNGVKIIKTSDLDLSSDYVQYINQKIKTAYLTIRISTPNKYETPFISNLKILVGDKNV